MVGVATAKGAGLRWRAARKGVAKKTRPVRGGRGQTRGGVTARKRSPNWLLLPGTSCVLTLWMASLETWTAACVLHFGEKLRRFFGALGWNVWGPGRACWDCWLRRPRGLCCTGFSARCLVLVGYGPTRPGRPETLGPPLAGSLYLNRLHHNFQAVSLTDPGLR